jgi:hypothetical protein
MNNAPFDILLKGDVGIRRRYGVGKEEDIERNGVS